MEARSPVGPKITIFLSSLPGIMRRIVRGDAARCTNNGLSIMACINLELPVEFSKILN